MTRTMQLYASLAQLATIVLEVLLPIVLVAPIARREVVLILYAMRLTAHLAPLEATLAACAIPGYQTMMAHRQVHTGELIAAPRLDLVHVVAPQVLGLLVRKVTIALS